MTRLLRARLCGTDPSPRSQRGLRRAGQVLLVALLPGLVACGSDQSSNLGSAGISLGQKELLLTEGRVYSFSWPAPDPDGTPNADAPVEDGVWRPDADAVLIRDGRIAFVGVSREARALASRDTPEVKLGGAVVLPGFVDSHTHVQGLGAKLRRVDLVGAATEDEVIERLRPRAAASEAGEWVIGWGWDEGAWAANYPDWDRLSEAFPDHPVALYSLHGFALWSNRLAFERAGIGLDTEAPIGGEIVRDSSGLLTGLLLNRATTLVRSAVPPPTPAQLERDVELGLLEMARSGYVGVHEAGLDRETLAAFERLAARDALPVRVYAMLSARDESLIEEWIERGPECGPLADESAGNKASDRLRVCSVKAYWDGALGSRGARLLEDYSDRPGHRGVSGEGYGFDEELVARAIDAGFQVAVHAIGDAGNRETLDFLSARTPPSTAVQRRHRVEHAQVVNPSDIGRFSEMGLIASMQPPHLAEDQAWAEERLGPVRVRHAYAWRTFAQSKVPLVFSSDLAGSDHDLAYGLHSAVTRRPRPKSSASVASRPGFVPEQAVTLEEAIRAYSLEAAFASFLEDVVGPIEVGRLADLTILRNQADSDLINSALSPTHPTAETWWQLEVVMTVVGGEVAFDARQSVDE